MNNHMKAVNSKKWEKQPDGSLKSGAYHIQKVRILGFGPLSGRTMHVLSFMGVEQDLYLKPAYAKQGAKDHASGADR